MSEEIKENLQNRQNLVDTAVSFLLNPNVRLRPDDAKIAFLKNKGLTDFEIAEAFSNVKNSAASDESNQMVNAYPMPPYQTPSSWLLLKSYGSTIISFAAALYLLHRLYKLYIEPWLFGPKSEKSEISALEERLIELNNNISQLNSTVASLEESVKYKMQEVDRFSLHDTESIPEAIKSIKDEVGNVKSLLLNRFSFPGAPKLPLVSGNIEDRKQEDNSKAPSKVVTIPKWQLRGSEPGKLGSGVADGKIEESEGKENSFEAASLERNLLTIKGEIQSGENNLRIADIETQEDSKTDSDNNTRCIENGIQVENSKETLESDVRKEAQIENSKSELSDTFESRDSNLFQETNGVEDYDILSGSKEADRINVSNGIIEH